MFRIEVVSTLLICCFTLNTSAVAQVSPEAVDVDVIYPKVEQRGAELKLVGTVEATQHAQIASEQAGRIEDIYVDAGDLVEKGQALLKLDDSLALLDSEEAHFRTEAAGVALTEARRLASEVEPLTQQKVIATTVLDERRTQVAAASAALAREKAILEHRNRIVEKHVVRAPFAGLLEHRHVSLGEWLSPQLAAFSLVSNQQLRVRAQIPQEYYFMLPKGRESVVTIHHEGLESEISGLKIDRLISVSQQQTRSTPALIELPSTSGLIPGMSVDVTILLKAEGSRSVWVPASAIKAHPDGGSSVIAVVNGQAKRVNVSLIDQEKEAALVSGLPKETMVVAKGIEYIKTGMALRVVNSQEFEL